MKRALSILYLFLSGVPLWAQDCVHTELSTVYEYKTHLRRIETGEAVDSCILQIVITNKLKHAVQTVTFNNGHYFSTVFADCNQVRSYLTGKNKEADVSDNDFGDLVIADFNFDNKEDFAFIRNSGGNGGPEYFFYIQNNKGEFVKDAFLSDSMEFFPSIDQKKKVLVTLVHANAREMCESTYRLDKNKHWYRAKRRWVEY